MLLHGFIDARHPHLIWMAWSESPFAGSDFCLFVFYFFIYFLFFLLLFFSSHLYIIKKKKEDILASGSEPT